MPTALRNTTPHGSTPTPDPTVLTTQQLQREILAVKDLFGQRIDAVEKAIEVAHEDLVRVPTEVDKSLKHLRELSEERLNTVNERFVAVEMRFKERDVRVEQTRVSAKDALDAALNAAKEAVGKQNENFGLATAKAEGATNKQIDQLGQLITTTNTATNAKMDDLKERILRLEGEDRGEKAATSTRVQSNQLSIGIIGLIVFGGLSFLGLVVSIVTRWGTH